MRFIEEISIDSIKVGDRHRDFDPAKVDALAGSMREIGLQYPIHVFLGDDNDGAQAFILVAGRHRLEAAKKLGWARIDAIQVDLSEAEREIWEISENLHRAGLTKAEEAQHLQRYAELIEQRIEHGKALHAELEEIRDRVQRDDLQTNEQTELVGRGDEIQTELDRVEELSGKSFPTWLEREYERRKKGPALILAEKLGIDKRTVNMALKRAKNIAPDVFESIKEMPAANKGVELDALAGMKHEHQREAVTMVKHGDAKDFRQAKKFAVPGKPLPRSGVALEEQNAAKREHMERMKSVPVHRLNSVLDELVELHDFWPEKSKRSENEVPAFTPREMATRIVEVQKINSFLKDKPDPDNLNAAARWLMEVEKELRELKKGGK